MESVRAQVTALTDELTALKGEIVQIKAAHATLHQSSVEANTIHNRSYAEQADRIVKMEKHIEDIATEIICVGNFITARSYNMSQNLPGQLCYKK